jgi:hypothetical protein
MKSKKVNLNRWLMHQKEPTSATLLKNVVVGNAESNDRRRMAADADELLFDDKFDDDDEMWELEEFEPVNHQQEEELDPKYKGQLLGSDDESEEERETEKKKSKDQAKDTAKLLKKMKEDYFDEGDDDPYANSVSFQVFSDD